MSCWRPGGARAHQVHSKVTLCRSLSKVAESTALSEVEVELTLAVGLALMAPGQSTRRGAPFLGGAVHEALVF